MKILKSRSQTSKFAQATCLVATGVTVTDGDLVQLSSGTVTTGTPGTGPLYGIVQGGRSDNLVSRNYRAPATLGDGTATVDCCLVEDMLFEMPVSAALASDAEGKFYNIQGATGAQVVNNASKSATVGQLLCLKRVADSTGAYTIGRFTVAAKQSNTTSA